MSQIQEDPKLIKVYAVTMLTNPNTAFLTQMNTCIGETMNTLRQREVKRALNLIFEN